MPTASNTGIPAGTVLKPIFGNVTITAANTVLNGLDIHGFVKVQAANVTIENSRIRGGPVSNSTGLINTTSPSAKNVLIKNCELAADLSTPWVDGVMGHDYTVLRSNVHNVVDGFGVFNAASPSADLNVDIEGNYVHDLNYLSPDPEQSDGHTHNDGVQIQGAGATLGKVQVKIVGNTLDAFAGSGSDVRSPYYPAVTGQGIGVTPNVSRIHDVVIDRNWLDGGAQSVTMIPGSKGTGGGMALTNNRFGRGQHTGHPVLLDPAVTIAAGNNTYMDNGSPITITVG